MKIERAEASVPTVTVAILCKGEPFSPEGSDDVYVKTDEYALDAVRRKCMNLETGVLAHFYPQDRVRRVNARVIID